jgi:uncharacterized protein YchJ
MNWPGARGCQRPSVICPCREEPNALAIQEHAPTMTVAQAGPAERIRFSAFALQDQRYIVQRTATHR